MELPGTVNAITVDGQPNLVSMLVEGMENLRTLRIIGEHQIQQQTQSLIQLAYTQAKNLNLVEIDNVLWTGFAVDAMMWLQQLEANLTGSISLSGNLSFDNKLALANTYGNIDDAANKLFINYTKRAINSISVNGPTYIAETGIYQYKLVCSPSTGNDVALKDGKLAIKWGIDDSAKTYGTFIDSANGILQVTKLDESGTDMRYLAQCELTKTTGTILTAEFQVGFYRRVPKIGDFAYADGTFDDQYMKDKTLVGIVYKLDEMWQGDNEAEPTILLVIISRQNLLRKQGNLWVIKLVLTLKRISHSKAKVALSMLEVPFGGFIQVVIQMDMVAYKVKLVRQLVSPVFSTCPVLSILQPVA